MEEYRKKMIESHEHSKECARRNLKKANEMVESYDAEVELAIENGCPDKERELLEAIGIQWENSVTIHEWEIRYYNAAIEIEKLKDQVEALRSEIV